MLTIRTIEENGSPLFFPGAWLPPTERRILVASALKAADRECRRMARLVSDMLLASSDSGNWVIQPERIEPDILLIEAYESFLPLCRQKDLALHLELPDFSIPPLWGDPERLEQVITILLDNAVPYTPNGKSIWSRLYQIDKNKRFNSGCHRTVIEIADDGNGIPDEMKRQIFDRFYRGDTSRKDKQHFGLGLSIAKELVELHGGTLTVSDRPGGGSRFIITLGTQ